MTQNHGNERDDFMGRLRDMRGASGDVVGGAVFIQKVLDGREHMSVHMFERVRDSQLRLRQAFYRVETIFKALKAHPLFEEFGGEAETVRDAAFDHQRLANEGFDEIVSWLPPQPSFRKASLSSGGGSTGWGGLN